jgi:hypothetical protein
MTVNTNGSKLLKTPAQHVMDEIISVVNDIRESQLRTEKMVTVFIASMSNNPVLGSMARMFGGR